MADHHSSSGLDPDPLLSSNSFYDNFVDPTAPSAGLDDDPFGEFSTAFLNPPINDAFAFDSVGYDNWDPLRDQNYGSNFGLDEPGSTSGLPDTSSPLQSPSGTDNTAATRSDTEMATVLLNNSGVKRSKYKSGSLGDVAKKTIVKSSSNSMITTQPLPESGSGNEGPTVREHLQRLQKVQTQHQKLTTAQIERKERARQAVAIAISTTHPTPGPENLAWLKAAQDIAESMADGTFKTTTKKNSTHTVTTRPLPPKPSPLPSNRPTSPELLDHSYATPYTRDSREPPRMSDPSPVESSSFSPRLPQQLPSAHRSPSVGLAHADIYRVQTTQSSASSHRDYSYSNSNGNHVQSLNRPSPAPQHSSFVPSPSRPVSRPRSLSRDSATFSRPRIDLHPVRVTLPPQHLGRPLSHTVPPPSTRIAPVTAVPIHTTMVTTSVSPNTKTTVTVAKAPSRPGGRSSTAMSETEMDILLRIGVGNVQVKMQPQIPTKKAPPQKMESVLHVTQTQIDGAKSKDTVSFDYHKCTAEPADPSMPYDAEMKKLRVVEIKNGVIRAVDINRLPLTVYTHIKYGIKVNQQTGESEAHIVSPREDVERIVKVHLKLPKYLTLRSRDEATNEWKSVHYPVRTPYILQYTRTVPYRPSNPVPTSASQAPAAPTPPSSRPPTASGTFPNASAPQTPTFEQSFFQYNNEENNKVETPRRNSLLMAALSSDRSALEAVPPQQRKYSAPPQRMTESYPVPAENEPFVQHKQAILELTTVDANDSNDLVAKAHAYVEAERAREAHAAKIRQAQREEMARQAQQERQRMQMNNAYRQLTNAQQIQAHNNAYALNNRDYSQGNNHPYGRNVQSPPQQIPASPHVSAALPVQHIPPVQPQSSVQQLQQTQPPADTLIINTDYPSLAAALSSPMTSAPSAHSTQSFPITSPAPPSVSSVLDNPPLMTTPTTTKKPRAPRPRKPPVPKENALVSVQGPDGMIAPMGVDPPPQPEAIPKPKRTPAKRTPKPKKNAVKIEIESPLAPIPEEKSSSVSSPGGIALHGSNMSLQNTGPLHQIIPPREMTPREMTTEEILMSGPPKKNKRSPIDQIAYDRALAETVSSLTVSILSAEEIRKKEAAMEKKKDELTPAKKKEPKKRKTVGIDDEQKNGEGISILDGHSIASAEQNGIHRLQGVLDGQEKPPPKKRAKKAATTKRTDANDGKEMAPIPQVPRTPITPKLEYPFPQQSRFPHQVPMYPRQATFPPQPMEVIPKMESIPQLGRYTKLETMSSSPAYPESTSMQPQPYHPPMMPYSSQFSPMSTVLPPLQSPAERESDPKSYPLLAAALSAPLISTTKAEIEQPHYPSNYTNASMRPPMIEINHVALADCPPNSLSIGTNSSSSSGNNSDKSISPAANPYHEQLDRLLDEDGPVVVDDDAVHLTMEGMDQVLMEGIVDISNVGNFDFSWFLTEDEEMKQEQEAIYESITTGGEDDPNIPSTSKGLVPSSNSTPSHDILPVFNPSSKGMSRSMTSSISSVNPILVKKDLSPIKEVPEPECLPESKPTIGCVSQKNPHLSGIREYLMEPVPALEIPLQTIPMDNSSPSTEPSSQSQSSQQSQSFSPLAVDMATLDAFLTEKLSPSALQVTPAALDDAPVLDAAQIVNVLTVIKKEEMGDQPRRIDFTEEQKTNMNAIVYQAILAQRPLEGLGIDLANCKDFLDEHMSNLVEQYTIEMMRRLVVNAVRQGEPYSMEARRAMSVLMELKIDVFQSEKDGYGENNENILPCNGNDEEEQLTDYSDDDSDVELDADEMEALNNDTTATDEANQKLVDVVTKHYEREGSFIRNAFFVMRNLKTSFYVNHAQRQQMAQLRMEALAVAEERKNYAKRLQHHERNHLRRVTTQKKKREKYKEQIQAAINNGEAMSVKEIKDKFTMPPPSLELTQKLLESKVVLHQRKNREDHIREEFMKIQEEKKLKKNWKGKKGPAKKKYYPKKPKNPKEKMDKSTKVDKEKPLTPLLRGTRQSSRLRGQPTHEKASSEEPEERFEAPAPFAENNKEEVATVQQIKKMEVDEMKEEIKEEVMEEVPVEIPRELEMDVEDELVEMLILEHENEQEGNLSDEEDEEFVLPSPKKSHKKKPPTPKITPKKSTPKKFTPKKAKVSVEEDEDDEPLAALKETKRPIRKITKIIVEDEDEYDEQPKEEVKREETEEVVVKNEEEEDETTPRRSTRMRSERVEANSVSTRTSLSRAAKRTF